MSHHHGSSKDFTEGLAHLQKKSWDQAISAFSKAIEVFGAESPEVFLKRGLAYQAKGWWDEAIDDFKTALRLGASSGDVFGLLAEAYRGKGWWDEAIHFWGAALERVGERADFYFRRGLAYFDKGWFNEAIEHFVTAANIDPQDSRIPYATAVALKLRGQMAEAERFLKRAIELGDRGYRKLFAMEFPPAEVETEKASPQAPPPQAVAPKAQTAAKAKAEKAPAKKTTPKKAAKAPAKKKAAARKATPTKKAPAKVAKSTVAKPKASSSKTESSVPSMLDAAFEVLEDAGQPLHYKDITKAALAKDLIKTEGATPEQSMRSAISREISSKGARARFRRNDKVGKGFYSLTYWDKDR
jgi:outer membrane biosynthesis protein TonB